ncbi:MAG: hypothetical protein H6591_06745 [Flavobacteriales bacterium]|nr:hypothetical protein [Flavobacteriales bacterium]
MRERGSTMRAVLVAGFLLATATCDAFYIRLHGLVTENFSGDGMKNAGAPREG